MRRIDCFLRFPFRDFDNCAVACAHDDRCAVRHERFLAQCGNTTSNQVQSFAFLSGLGPIRDNDNDAVHNSDIMIAIFQQGKQFDQEDAELLGLARSKRFVETMTD